MALTEYADKLQAIYTLCGKSATRNQQLIGSEPTHIDDPIILVGAGESYEVRCQNCYILRWDQRLAQLLGSKPHARAATAG